MPSAKVLACALANEPRGGEMPAPEDMGAVLAALVPRPVLHQRDGTVLIEPTARPCAYHGRVYLLDRGQPREATADELLDLRDACGEADFDRRPLFGGLTVVEAAETAFGHGAPVSPCLGVTYNLHSTGAEEAAVHGLPPLESRWLRGPLAEAVEAAISEVLARHCERPDALGRILRELLVNAVGHRSYAPRFHDRAVVVDDFSDTIRITSPGNLPRRVRLRDGAIDGRWSRNPMLMALLMDARLAHQQGRGLSVAPLLARDAGYELAVQAVPDAVVVELRVRPALWLRPPDRVRQRAPAPVREQRIADHLARVSEASAAEIARALTMPASTVRAALRGMVADQRVEPTCEAARSPSQRYRLVDASTAAAGPRR